MKLTNKLSLVAATATFCLFGFNQVVAQEEEAPQEEAAAQEEAASPEDAAAQEAARAAALEPGETQEPAQRASSINELLEMVEQARMTETQAQREREQRFQENVNQRQAMLSEMEQRQASEEAISAELDTIYEENERIKAERFETLQERLGDLRELFGTISSVVGDTRATFENSLISAQFQGRDAFLADLADVLTSESQLPSTEELERLWFYLMQEITETGKITKFETNVAQPDGNMASQEVVRIGAYNIVSDGQYLRFDPNTGRLSVLPSQPAGYTSTAADLQAAAEGTVTKVGIDPTGPQGGSYLAALISYPSLRDRIEQGGSIGYIILAVGAFALLIALERMFTLTIVGSKVRAQLKNPAQPKKNNPLGRVLMVYEAEKNTDVETLELKLGEAILKETPALERFITLLKIISTVAPLMGLLGTVRGMIQVFQAITLFGTGDPQIMAGGISGALVTTVEGLVVAIPAVLLHTIVKGRSDRIIHVLEEQTTGMIARQAEENEGKTA